MKFVVKARIKGGSQSFCITTCSWLPQAFLISAVWAGLLVTPAVCNRNLLQIILQHSNLLHLTGKSNSLPWSAWCFSVEVGLKYQYAYFHYNLGTSMAVARYLQGTRTACKIIAHLAQGSHNISSGLWLMGNILAGSYQLTQTPTTLFSLQ